MVAGRNKYCFLVDLGTGSFPISTICLSTRITRNFLVHIPKHYCTFDLYLARAKNPRKNAIWIYTPTIHKAPPAKRESTQNLSFPIFFLSANGSNGSVVCRRRSRFASHRYSVCECHAHYGSN